jgi:hypothetical protein
VANVIPAACSAALHSETYAACTNVLVTVSYTVGPGQRLSLGGLGLQRMHCDLLACVHAAHIRRSLEDHLGSRCWLSLQLQSAPHCSATAARQQPCCARERCVQAVACSSVYSLQRDQQAVSDCSSRRLHTSTSSVLPISVPGALCSASGRSSVLSLYRAHLILNSEPCMR